MDTEKKKAQKTAGQMLSTMKADITKGEYLAAAYANDQRVSALTEAENFNRRLAQYRELSRLNPNYLNTLWFDEMNRLHARMKEQGQVQLLDHYLSSEGINITEFPLFKKK
jgi:hypothetical protein